MNQEQKELLKQYEAACGAFLDAHGVDFKDGRKVLLAEFERKYVLVFTGIMPDGKETVSTIPVSRETMYAVGFMYATLRPLERAQDSPLFSQNVSDECAGKLSEAIRDYGVVDARSELNEAALVLQAVRNFRHEWQEAKRTGELETPVNKLLAVMDAWEDKHPANASFIERAA